MGRKCTAHRSPDRSSVVVSLTYPISHLVEETAPHAVACRREDPTMIQEFKEFIQRGNVVDLAVAVVIGAAFALIVKSFTDDILMPIIGIIGGQPKFDYSFAINDSVINWGLFLTAIVNFLIVAFAVFLVVKGINKMQNLRKKEELEEAEITEVELLTEIRDLLVSQNGGSAASVPSSTAPPSS
jgi:large conductance mechanosensitive channel